MKYVVKKYGDDVVIESTAIDAATVEAIKAELPPTVQAKVIGFRKIASVTAGRAT